MVKKKNPRSSLKEKPLRLPGQSIEEEIDRVVNDSFMPFLITAAMLIFVAVMEWFAVWRHVQRLPWLYTVLALLAIVVCWYKFRQVRIAVARLKLGRDGERVVSLYLEILRQDGCVVFHDIPGDGFNLDHVILSPRGFFAIETKTWSKPTRGEAKITLVEQSIRVNGKSPERDPVRQARAAADWLARRLESSTGKSFTTKGVVLIPEWWVDPMPQAWKANLPWVLNPKALKKFIEQERTMIDRTDVQLAADHLQRYIRSLHSD